MICILIRDFIPDKNRVRASATLRFLGRKTGRNTARATPLPKSISECDFLDLVLKSFHEAALDLLYIFLDIDAGTLALPLLSDSTDSVLGR